MAGEKKNNIVLVGNGFDLAHGLNTTYLQFLNQYFDKIVERVNTTFSFDDENWTITLKLDNGMFAQHPINRAFLLSTPNQSIDYKNDFLVKIIYFLNELNQKEEPLWADLEGLYYKNLRDIADDSVHNRFIVEIDKLNNGFESIKKLLIEYLIEEDKKSNNHTGHYVPPLYSFGKKLWDSEFANAFIVNFNYTSTFNLYQPYNGDIRIIHLHGNLADQENNPIIFGFGDTKDDHYKQIENLNDKRFLKYSKTIAYTHSNNYRDLYDFVEGLDRDEGYDVHIIGLSCGITDRVLLNYVLEHDDCKRITVHHYRDRENFNDTVSNISRVFNDKQKFNARLVAYDEDNKYA